MRGRPPIGTRPQTRPNVKCMSPQTDSYFRASHVQRVSGYADNLSDLVWTLSPLYEVADLLHSFWRKLYWSSATQRLRCQLNGLGHFLPPLLLTGGCTFSFLYCARLTWPDRQARYCRGPSG